MNCLLASYDKYNGVLRGGFLPERLHATGVVLYIADS